MPRPGISVTEVNSGVVLLTAARCSVTSFSPPMVFGIEVGICAGSNKATSGRAAKKKSFLIG